MTGLAGVPEPLPFSLEQFRESATAIFGESWAALDYYLSDDELNIAVVRPNGLAVTRRKLAQNDRVILAECLATDPQSLKSIYGDAHGRDPATSTSLDYLTHLHCLLIPEHLDAQALIIAPHRRLHGLPFHALINGGVYLIERHKVVYVPSLHVAQHLFKEPVANRSTEALVLGVSNFGDRMSPLVSAKAEVEKMLAVFGERAQVLWDDRATRRKLVEMNSSGELQRFSLLHLASHAILNHGAPHRSRIFLHDDELSTLDILDLTLNAQLVTLTGCQTALGKGGRGDEALSLARAFFYAGARALLATLWPVEDATAFTKPIEEFYRSWSTGTDAAEALQNASIKMIRSRIPPYYWAPFVLSGRP